MRFDLQRIAARKRKSRRPITFAPILTTKAQAGDLAALHMRMLAPLSARESIVDVYAREIERLQSSDSGGQLTTDSPNDLRAAADAIANAINRLVLELTPAMREWAFRVEQWHRGKWVRAVLAGVEVDLETLIGPEDEVETIDTWLVRNTSLIRDVNEQARARIADAVLRGFQQRSPISEVAKEIRAATGFARKRARRVAADQTVKLASALDRERQRQAGLDHWKWKHSHKLNYRPEHKARDGRLYTDETAPEDEPGELPFCGCVRQAVLVFEGEVL